MAQEYFANSSWMSSRSSTESFLLGAVKARLRLLAVSGRVASGVERRARHPHAMERGAHAHRQPQDGERPVGQSFRIQDGEVTAVLGQAIHDREQITFALGRTGPHHEVRLLHPTRARFPRAERALRVVETADRAHSHYPGPRRGRAADRVAIAI